MPTVAAASIVYYAGKPVFTWRWKGDDYWHSVDLITEKPLCWEWDL